MLHYFAFQLGRVVTWECLLQHLARSELSVSESSSFFLCLLVRCLVRGCSGSGLLWRAQSHPNSSKLPLLPTNPQREDLARTLNSLPYLSRSWCLGVIIPCLDLEISVSFLFSSGVNPGLMWMVAIDNDAAYERTLQEAPGNSEETIRTLRSW